jgi:parvulin-like peptidyl-prolyl isomerase
MFFSAVGLISLTQSSVVAQEGEAQVVDEVVAQVNDDVITLTMLNREIKERIENLKQQGGMTQQKAQEEVAKRQAELIATLINERLLIQKGKELDLANDIEAEVNRRMLEIAREQGITTIEALNKAMKDSGLDPAGIRDTMRAEMMKQAVMQQEVDRKIFFGFPIAEVKKYYETNKDKFRKPESLTLSEIYLTLNGKDEASVKARANELVAQLRAGADFKAVASANSEREKNNERTAPKDGGLVGTFEVPSLRDDLVAALKNIPAGGVTDPIRTNEGYQILRVDQRTPQGTTPTFNENQVREAMTIERSPGEREKYLQTLRNEAFIAVTDNFRDSVMPLLKLSSPATAKSKDTKKEKK